MTTVTETVAETIVKLAQTAAFTYGWLQWIKYLTARLGYFGKEPVPGVPIGWKKKDATDGKD